MRQLGKPLEYTGEELAVKVTHVQCGYGISDNWVGLSHTRPGAIFRDKGADIEKRMEEHADISCPACGGSGHKDDFQALQSMQPKSVPLDERMKAAGMMSVSDMLENNALGKYSAHAGVNSLEAFDSWLKLKHEEFIRLHARIELDKETDGDLYEWVIAHAAVLGSVRANFRQALQSLKGEAVEFTCHGRSAPAYSCNKPGDMSGTYYTTHQPPALQPRVLSWLLECFGAEIANDRIERNHRFLEESLELVQSTGCTKDEAHKLVDYVFGRPTGEPMQEVGGVMITLAALCLANGLDMHSAGEAELARITQPEMVIKIREKQKRKPAMSPLPGVYPERQAPSTEQRKELSGDFQTTRLMAAKEMIKDGNYDHALNHLDRAIKCAQEQPPAVPDGYADLVRYAYSEGQGRGDIESSEFRWVDSESNRRLEALLTAAQQGGARD